MTSHPLGHLVGGISSAGRALPPLDGENFLVARASGPYLWDVAGRRYVDTAMGFGATVLGHAPASVVEAVAAAAARGMAPAFAHPAEEAAAAALAARTGPLQSVVFVSTGSEAVHLASRIARTLTGRRRIAKMAAGYDGWYDDIAFGNAGSPEAAPQLNRRPATDHTALLRYNDMADTEALFADHDDIAAVLVEPVLANAGCVEPAPGYLAHLQQTAHRHGALVIADEVLMGFRLRSGLTAHHFDLDPDLATVGKAIGSGAAVAAVVGRPDIMAAVADGRVNRAGTYSGNPVACAAVLATMAELDRVDYPALLARGAGLRASMADIFAARDIPFSTSGVDSVFTPWFAASPPADYAGALDRIRPTRSRALHDTLRRNGVMLMPTPFGRIFLSFAHDAEALATLEVGFAAAADAIA